MQCKRLCWSFTIVCILTPLISAIPINAVHAASPIFISEIAWAGSSFSTSDEWIELGNLSETPISIGGWHLVGAGDGGRDIVLPNNALIPEHGTYLIANYPNTDTRCSLTIEPNVVTSTIALSNSTQLIRLLDTDKEEIDRVGNGAAPFSGYSSTAKASMERINATISGDLQSAWKTSETNLNLKTQDYGTPGYIIQNSQTTDTLTTTENNESQTETPIPNNLTNSSSTVIINEEVDGQHTTTSQLTIEDHILETTTSTNPSNSNTASSTQNSTMVINDTTSTNTATNSLALNTTAQDIGPLVSNQIYLRLNEVMPNPGDGPEWVEITNSLPDRPVTLDGLHLEDAIGSVAAIHGWLTPTQTHIVVSLTSARFNNSGDSVRLVDANGVVIDSFTYLESHASVSWSRDEQGAWRETTDPTPGEQNSIIEIPQTDLTATKNEVILAKSETSQTTKINENKSTSKISIPKTAKTTSSTTKDQLINISTKQKTAALNKSTSTKSVATKNSATKKVATLKSTVKNTSSSPAPTLMTIDMLNTLDQGNIRVLLYGTVGTQPGLMTGRSFILLNAQGRGLLVRVGSDKKLPSIGSSVRVTGILKFDANELPYLSFNKNDGWFQLTTNDAQHVGADVKPEKREVAWFAPSTEDAWCLAQASGTISSISGQTVSITTDDGEVDIKIRPTVGYRASRLKSGDSISVTGILVLGNEKPAIFPRTADEIILVAHAKPIETNSIATNVAPTGLPGWTPFGAAAIAVGAIQGAKAIRKRKNQRKEKAPQACGAT